MRMMKSLLKNKGIQNLKIPSLSLTSNNAFNFESSLFTNNTKNIAYTIKLEDFTVNNRAFLNYFIVAIEVIAVYYIVKRFPIHISLLIHTF